MDVGFGWGCGFNLLQPFLHCLQLAIGLRPSLANLMSMRPRNQGSKESNVEEVLKGGSYTEHSYIPPVYFYHQRKELL